MTTRKVMLVGIDGLRIDDALRPGAAPRLAGFVDAGTITPLTMEVPTISGPGWSSLLTGATHAEHGVVDNTFSGHTLAPDADFLSRAAADQHRTTFAAAGWPPLVDPAGPGPVIATRDDQRRSGQHVVVVRDGELYGHRVVDGEITAAGVLAIREWGPDAAFVYLGGVDEAGHLYGGTSPEYAAAILQADGRLGRLLDAIRVRVARDDVDEDWLVAVTTDHGHLDEGGHGGAEPVLRRSFLALRRLGRLGAPGAALPVPAPTGLEPWDVPGVLLAHLDG
ncbi:alkaline phosphatase family protein [Curtobacterium sp. RRHDQ10]|uniref:alkaline phosphatase family protein n=1 Tax=Curtobacterium phyllosphaerae TaxID=3413379 RepID=UPI003BF3F288